MGSRMSGYDKPCKYGGSVWIEESAASMFGQKYALVVNGKIEAQSDEWSYIVGKFHSYAA